MLSNDTLAELSTSNPPVLTAEEAGMVTITATWNGLTATSQITISVGGATLPLGSVVCSLPSSTSGYAVQQIMQTVPSSGTTPDLVAVEDDGQGSIWLRGLTSGCEQSWHTRVGSSSSGSGVDLVVGETPDNLGGVIVMVQNNNSAGVYPATNSLIDVNGVSGSPSWRYDSAGALVSQNPSTAAAVDQNGYILAVEDSQLSLYGYSQAQLIKIDPSSGSKVASWTVPSSTSSFVADQCGYENSQFTSSTSIIAATSGPISVGPDGSYYLQIAWETSVSWMVPVTIGNPSGLCALDDTTYEMTTGTTSTQLATVSPAGSLSLADLPGSPNTNIFQPLSVGKVIPDGNGGALATSVISTGANQVSVQVSDIGGSGRTATLPLNYAQQPDIVLGDQGTYFITDGTQVIDVNEASGGQLWDWQPSEGTVQIIAATAGGGVAVLNVVGNQEDVVRLDSSDNATYDTWGTAGGSSGYGVLSNSSYFANDLWLGTAGGPVISGMTGEPLQTANTNWPWGNGGGAGDHEGQAIGPPALKLQATSDCTEPNPSLYTPPYERDVDYQLVDLHNHYVLPSNFHYTIYEKLSPYKQFATCKVNGNYTGVSPCGPVSGGSSDPYDVFNDAISPRGSAPAPGLVNYQSFFYQLPGQRWWPVLEIDRWGGRSTPWIEPVPGSSLNLFLLNGAQPLINGQRYPYMAPASGSVQGCNGQPPPQ
jgi:hypothetical protein